MVVMILSSGQRKTLMSNAEKDLHGLYGAGGSVVRLNPIETALGIGVKDANSGVR